MVHRKKDLAPVCAATGLPANSDVPDETGAAPLMDWDDVKKLLGQKFTAAKLDSALRLLESPLTPERKNKTKHTNICFFFCIAFVKCFSPRFRYSKFSRASHRAGSPGDEDLGNKVLSGFQESGMKTWTDEHFVKVQDGPASGANRVVYKDQPAEFPKGFLSYSANGSVNVGS